MIKRLAYALPLALLVSPAIALAAAPRNFMELVNLLVTIMNAAVIVLVTLGLVTFLYGVSTSIYEAKDKGGEKLRSYVVWGILILFVMVSIWGILEVLKNTFLEDSPFDGGTPSFTDPSFSAPGFPTN